MGGEEVKPRTALGIAGVLFWKRGGHRSWRKIAILLLRPLRRLPILQGRAQTQH